MIYRGMVRMVIFLSVVCGQAARLPSAAAAEATVLPPGNAPDYQAAPRPDDGAHLALTVEKLQRGFDPPRPLLIWAIGSSFTNGLGNGDFLAERIQQRFGDAPPIEYKRIAGNSTSYHFSRGWARHLVIPDQPDVVLLYNFGKTEDLEALIAELRDHTTADILVGSLHWCVPHKPLWPDPEARNSHQDPRALRAMCREYGVEFVENRRELTQYMLDHQLTVEDLLGDSVHQTRDARNNRAGDRFTFEVFRATMASVDFRAEKREKFRLRLADYLSNGPHVLRLLARGDGAVTVQAFDVFQPLLDGRKENSDG
jgi:hypothetical protein